jgi:hypothetical protein
VGSEQPATTPERDQIEDTVDGVIDDAIHDRVEGASAEGLDRGVDVDRATGGLGMADQHESAGAHGLESRTGPFAAEWGRTAGARTRRRA